MKRRWLEYFRWLALPLALAFVLFATGCSRFNRDWKTAAAAAVPASTLEGRWLGTWFSEPSGHTDRLRCLITKQPDGQFNARFHAKYHKTFSYKYTVPLTVLEKDGVFTFSGEANLGWLAGGVYHYAGRATPTNYFSTYRCPYDHGTFQMTRPRPEE